MNEWWLLVILGILSLFATGLMVYPLLRNSKISLFLVPLMLLFLFLNYATWGGFTSLQKHLHHQHAKILAKEMFESFKSPEDLIMQLKEKLNDKPENAKGWYLLGRIYSSQNDEKKAVEAFAKAHSLQPKNEQFAVYYAHSLWNSNHQKFNADILEIFESLLKNNAKQPDALAMLAMNAFLNHKEPEAIVYWQRLLAVVPRQSEEAVSLRQAIAKAQKRLLSRKAAKKT